MTVLAPGKLFGIKMRAKIKIGMGIMSITLEAAVRLRNSNTFLTTCFGTNSFVTTNRSQSDWLRVAMRPS
jgi:hypothetical protein